jgi:predicted nucleic acid-binding protein
MIAPVFVDTSVFIYAVDEADPSKQGKARLWLAELSRSRAGRTGFQVLQEFYVRAVQKRPGTELEVRKAVGDLLLWHPSAVSGEVLAEAWKAQDRYRFSFWDALIVGAAKTARCTHLLTEDLQDSQDLDGIIVVNPFLHEPADLL